MSYDISITTFPSRPSPGSGGDTIFSSRIDVSRPERETNFAAIRTPRRSSVPSKGLGASLMRVKRRLHAFFVQEEGEESRVAFVEGTRLIHYYLPTRLLKEAGVQAENQPFELDELEATVEGTVMHGYKVRPSARVQDAFPSPLPLDPERTKKLDFILKRKWDARG